MSTRVPVDYKEWSRGELEVDGTKFEVYGPVYQMLGMPGSEVPNDSYVYVIETQISGWRCRIPWYIARRLVKASKDPKALVESELKLAGQGMLQSYVDRVTR